MKTPSFLALLLPPLAIASVFAQSANLISQMDAIMPDGPPIYSPARCRHFSLQLFEKVKDENDLRGRRTLFGLWRLYQEQAPVGPHVVAGVPVGLRVLKAIGKERLSNADSRTWTLRERSFLDGSAAAEEYSAPVARPNRLIASAP